MVIGLSVGHYSKLHRNKTCHIQFITVFIFISIFISSVQPLSSLLFKSTGNMIFLILLIKLFNTYHFSQNLLSIPDNKQIKISLIRLYLHFTLTNKYRHEDFQICSNATQDIPLAILSHTRTYIYIYIHTIYNKYHNIYIYTEIHVLYIFTTTDHN